MSAPIPVFDGHNDLLLRLWRAAPAARDRLWLEGDGEGHLDLPRMRRGGFAGGLFAIYVPSPADGAGARRGDGRAALRHAAARADPRAARRRRPRSPWPGSSCAWSGRRRGDFRLCRSAAEIRGCLDAGVVAAVMHMEGAEAIGPDLDALHVLHAAGLRSLGPVWSRPTAFGHGVPFRFPGDPDTGPGLTPRGQGAGARLRRAADPGRPLAPERRGFRGRGGGLDRAAGRDPLQRPRGLPLDAAT